MATNSDQNVTPPHSHPLQKWILFGLVFIGVPLMIYFGFLIKGKTELQKVQKEYKATGYPITLQELDDWYPTPAGDNAADLYIQAAGQMVDYPVWDPGKEILGAFERELSRGKLEEDQALINRVLPYIGVGEMPELGQRIDQATLALIESYVHANQQAIETLYKAMAIKESRYPVEITKGIGLLLPHLRPLGNEANLLALQALVDTHANRPAKAVQSLLAIHATARSLDREPILVSFWLQILIQAQALYQTENTLNMMPLSDHDLVQLSDSIDELLKSDGFIRAMVGECIVNNDLFTSPPKAMALYASNTVITLLKLMGQYDRGHARYLKGTMAYIEATQLPLGQKYPEFQSIEGKHLASLNKYCKKFYLFFLTSAEVALRVDRIFTQAIVQKVGLAVERYRLKHGKLPEKLADLTPEFLGKLPDDPFTGKPLLYKKFDDGGFMVYSTGQDATDDGGKRNLIGEDFVSGSDICFEIRR